MSMAGLSARSHNGVPLRLPDIRHTMQLLEGPNTLSVRGLSRPEGGGDRSASSHGSSRKTTLRENLKKYRVEQMEGWRDLDHWANTDKTPWERHETKKKREDIVENDISQLKNQTEELEFQLLEKINSGGFYELKRLFLSHDPEGRGSVTRDALLVILTTFLGRFISKSQFLHLLERLHMGEKPVITFNVFYDHFKLEENNNPPDWLDPMKRKQKGILRTAHEVHLELKDMANNRYFELLKLFPKNSQNSLKFRSSLSRLGIIMSDEEYKKLWERYVKEDNGILGLEDLRRQLGVKHPEKSYEERSVLLSALQKVSNSRQEQIRAEPAVGSRMRTERKLSLSIEKWLKEKFREGARAMMAEFLVYDPERTHKVSRDDFLQVLEKFQLHLSRDQLGHFLARCSMEENAPDVDYVDFLQRLQTRRKNEKAQKILYKTGNRAVDRQSVSSESTTGVIEEKLLQYFHADFSTLLDDFRYCMKVMDEEFGYLLEKIPVDHQGAIRYLKFMAKFDSGDENLSLWGGNKTVVTNYSQKAKVTSKPSNGKMNQPQERSGEQLTSTIKDLVKNNYELLERSFNEMDAMNTRRLTAESLYQLLKRCGIHPEVSREEVRKIWKMLIQNQDQTVDYYQFVRHFGFSTRSSCFPNAKISPPVRGDVDCFIRSLKLNSDTRIIANFLQTKVKLLLDELWAQFRELDPHNSGSVTTEEFLDLLQELSPDLTKHQCDTLATKFREGPHKVSYVRFLEPYQTVKSPGRHNAGKQIRSEAKVTSPSGSVDRGLNAITSKLRQKLSTVDWKNLLQACQKLDANGSGFLLLPEFRSVVRLCNIVLDEDDIYHIMSHYDKDLAGKINYSHLVKDHIKTK
ncbi:EF-hand calcium-binding domain-containing protein 6-like isoform X1 [Hyperolius riggenbachi]|uniref:EF-hand calcium-binding domain-containing protein 6-like isoform X1 n=1 Tax=Hyperolius riggenbachi TaxID=752182 RepID=UPI0035A39512